MSVETEVPTLSRTQSGRAWRIPALLVGGALVGLVALARWGATDGGPKPVPTAAAVAHATAQASDATEYIDRQQSSLPPGTQARSERQPSLLTVGGSGDVYVADGLPARIGTQRVLRIVEALDQPLGTSILVGGWYIQRQCHNVTRRLCAAPTISDVRVDNSSPGWLSTVWVALDTRLEKTGGYVLRGNLERDPRCSISNDGQCQPRLDVTDVVVSGIGVSSADSP